MGTFEDMYLQILCVQPGDTHFFALLINEREGSVMDENAS